MQFFLIHLGIVSNILVDELETGKIRFEKVCDVGKPALAFEVGRGLDSEQLRVRIAGNGGEGVEGNLYPTFAVVIEYDGLTGNGGHQCCDALLAVDENLLALGKRAVLEFD